MDAVRGRCRRGTDGMRQVAKRGRAMEGHHLILGKLSDYLSGDTLDDTHDERYRQQLARLLVEGKRYHRSDITPRCKVLIKAGDNCAVVNVDFAIAPGARTGMIVKYGPGSLTTRHRPSLAASRLIAPYQVPLAVVTNGVDCELLDAVSGKTIARGFDAIPERQALVDVISRASFEPISARQAEMEARILFAYEIDDACPCDTSVCRL